MEKEIQEQKSRHVYLAQAVINSLLRFSLENITLEGFLKCGLSVILSTPPFSITSKGAIYLIEDDPNYLVMKAQSKLPPNVEKNFKRISFDQHPFGKAISSGRVKFIEELSDDYGLKKTHAKSYAYYCVPLLYSGNVLGAMDIFLKKGHPRIKREEEFLIAAANTLAGVSQRKRFEERLKKIQYTLIQFEKLSALGRFSSGIAHEVKNPLGIILGGIEFLEKKLVVADKDVKMAMKKIKEATLRADSVVRNLLRFAMPAEIKLEKVTPQDLINDTLALLRYRVSLINIHFLIEFSKEDIFIEIDKNQIQQVLFNLIINAVEAMSKGGQIKIKVYKTMLSEIFADKPACVIEIIDSGEGIPPDNIPKLFEPFFTTKRDKKGTGLGLSVSKMILENHKGTLTIDSEYKKGTTAKVILPAIE